MILGDMMNEVVMIRVPKDLIDDLRKKFKEIEQEDNTTVVRVLLKKLLEDA